MISDDILETLSAYEQSNNPVINNRRNDAIIGMVARLATSRNRNRVLEVLRSIQAREGRVIQKNDIEKIKYILDNDDTGYGSYDRSSITNNMVYKRYNRNNNRGSKRSIERKLKERNGRRLRSNHLDEIGKMLNTVGINRSDANEIETILSKVKESDNNLKSNNINRITNILFDREGLSEMAENETEDEDVDYSHPPLCINHSVSDCPSDTCVVQKKKCVPNILNNENLCYNKNVHECVKPCRFFGKSVHDKGSCHYFYSNLDEAKTEHKYIMKHIAQFEKYIDILKSKSKSLISYLNSQLKKINTGINKLETKKNKLDTKFEYPSKITNYEELMEEVRTTSDELMNLTRRKSETNAILSQIKYLTNLNVSKNKKKTKKIHHRGVNNNRRYRNTLTRYSYTY